MYTFTISFLSRLKISGIKGMFFSVHMIRTDLLEQKKLSKLKNGLHILKPEILKMIDHMADGTLIHRYIMTFPSYFCLDKLNTQETYSPLRFQKSRIKITMASCYLPQVGDTPKC